MTTKSVIDWRLGKKTLKKKEQRKEKLGKESLNEPRKSSRYEMRQTNR